MDELIKFNNQTAGRDKVFRIAQYTSRIVWHSLSQRKACAASAEKARRLDANLGLMRRILRFGRFFETLHSALPVMTSVSDPFIRVTCVLSRISNTCFMLIDHIVCLDKMGVLPPNTLDSGKWDLTSTRFWLYSITLGLLRDFYEITRIYKEEFQHLLKKPSVAAAGSRTQMRKKASYESALGSDSTSGGNLRKNIHVAEFVEQSRLVSKCIRDHADVAIDTLKNLCDLFLPLNSLGFVKLSPATVGLLGVVSTVASAVPMINPMMKMVPAT